MTARRWLVTFLVLVLAHLLRPYLPLVIVAEVAVFAGTVGVLAWMGWTGRASVPGGRLAAGKAGAR